MNLRSMISPLQLIDPQAIGTSAVNGTAIVRPWETHRKLGVMAIAGDLVAADALTVTVQARRIGTSTWDSVKENDGSTALTLTVSKLSDTGEVENGIVFGSIDLTRLKYGTNLDSTYTYDALRISAVNANNTSPGIVGFCGFLADPYTLDESASATDDLYFKQTPYTVPA